MPQTFLLKAMLVWTVIHEKYYLFVFFQRLSSQEGGQNNSLQQVMCLHINPHKEVSISLISKWGMFSLER